MEKDLKNYKIRTDLAIEEKIDSNDIVVKEKKYGDIKVTSVKLLSDNPSINKKKGKYITIEFKDVTDYDNNKMVERVFINEVKKVIKNYNYILIVIVFNDIKIITSAPIAGNTFIGHNPDIMQTVFHNLMNMIVRQ